VVGMGVVLGDALDEEFSGIFIYIHTHTRKEYDYSFYWFSLDD